MRPAAAVLALAITAAGCSHSAGGGRSRSISVAGEQVPVAVLVDAHAGLCEAAADTTLARQLFYDRSHQDLHTVARALEDVDRAQAGALLEAKQKVEGEIDAPPPSLRDDLLRLADVYRASLRRLAIEAPPCVE